MPDPILELLSGFARERGVADGLVEPLSPG